MFLNIKGAKQTIFGAGDVNAAVTEAEWLKAYKQATDVNGHPVTVGAYSSETIYEHNVSDLQEDIIVEGNKITGKLKFVKSGALPEYWNLNYFIALEFTTIPEDATHVYIGWDQSAGTGLVDIIDDPDKAAACAVTPSEDRKVTQKLIVKTETPDSITIQKFDLSGIELEEEMMGR